MRRMQLAWVAVGVLAMVHVAVGQIERPYVSLPEGNPIDLDATSRSPKSGPVRMNKPFDLPLGGVRLSMPAGYLRNPAGEDYQILLATQLEGGNAAKSLSLLAIPVEEQDVSAKDLSARLVEPMQTSLAIRHLNILEESESTVAGAEAALRSMTYTYRSLETTARSAVFVRQVPQEAGVEPLRLAYLLTMEMAAGRDAELDEAFSKVLESIEWIDFVHPLQMETDYEKGKYLKDWLRGYAICQPEGWIGMTNEIGLVLVAVDYRAGALPSPLVQAVAVDLAEAVTAQQAGLLAIEQERQDGRVTLDVLSEGAVQMAGRDGYQYVLRRTEVPTTQSATQPATDPRQAIEVMRVIVAQAPGTDTLRSYALLVTAYDVPGETLISVVDQLAERFSLFNPTPKKVQIEPAPLVFPTQEITLPKGELIPMPTGSRERDREQEEPTRGIGGGVNVPLR